MFSGKNNLCNFGTRHYEKTFCEVILNLTQWFRRRGCLKIFLIYSSGDHFVQGSIAICAILVENIRRNISEKHFLTTTLAAILFGGVKPFVQF